MGTEVEEWAITKNAQGAKMGADILFKEETFGITGELRLLSEDRA